MARRSSIQPSICVKAATPSISARDRASKTSSYFRRQPLQTSLAAALAPRPSWSSQRTVNGRLRVRADRRLCMRAAVAGGGGRRRTPLTRRMAGDTQPDRRRQKALPLVIESMHGPVIRASRPPEVRRRLLRLRGLSTELSEAPRLYRRVSRRLLSTRRSSGRLLEGWLLSD